MTISVVIPARNEEHFIGTCLKSLMNQEVMPDEIIVVNNNSTDKTSEVLKEYPVKVVMSHEPGIAKTRTRGFNEAKSDIIARTDADSQIPRDWIKKIKNHFEHESIDAVFGPIYYLDFPIKATFYSEFFVYLMRIIQGHHTIIGPNMAITKKIWDKVKSQTCEDDHKVHEDIDLGYHINAVGGKIVYDRSMIVATSGRRIKGNMLSFFGEYPIRLFKTLEIHKNVKD